MPDEVHIPIAGAPICRDLRMDKHRLFHARSRRLWMAGRRAGAAIDGRRSRILRNPQDVFTVLPSGFALGVRLVGEHFNHFRGWWTLPAAGRRNRMDGTLSARLAWCRLLKMSHVDAAAFLMTACSVLAVTAVPAVAIGCSIYVAHALYVRWARPTAGVPDLQAS